MTERKTVWDMEKAIMIDFFEGKSGCIELGVAYELQVAEQLPTEENDLPMSYLVTEKNLW